MPSSNSPWFGFAIPGASTVRVVACVSTLALLSACASHNGQQLTSAQEAAHYQARARHNYTPPGPPSDPWGPYIAEASARFDIPERWIREVMRVESSYNPLDTSQVGAMGLMQVMPGTYDILRARYSLGDDAYEPHDNVMAGTAYLREMYDIYGSPGFLAAYNAGPGRLDDYLNRNRPLPDETRHYVRKIAPYIADSQPNRPSAAGDVAMNHLPIDIPPGPRYPRHRQSPAALAENRYGRPGSHRPVQTAYLAEPPAPPVQTAAGPAARRGFHLVSPAMADTMPTHNGAGGATGGHWAIQVGAFSKEQQARAAADAARGQAHDLLAHAHASVGTVHASNATMYRARLTGLSRDAAVHACEKLGRRGSCIVLSPESQG